MEEISVRIFLNLDVGHEYILVWMKSSFEYLVFFSYFYI